MDFLSDTVLESVVGSGGKNCRESFGTTRRGTISGSVELFVAQHDLPEHRHLVERWSELVGPLRGVPGRLLPLGNVRALRCWRRSPKFSSAISKVFDSDSKDRNHTGGAVDLTGRDFGPELSLPWSPCFSFRK